MNDIPRDGLIGYLGPNSKAVVINDYLPAGMMFVTAREVIVSKVGYERVIRKIETQEAVRRIVERELGDVLAWLRGAGHDV